MVVKHPRHVYKHLAAGATIDATGDYSSSATTFKWTPTAGRDGYLNRMLISISDAGSLVADKYGFNLTLVNGLSPSLFDANDNVIIDLTDGDPILTNGDWASFCHDLTVHEGLGNVDMATIRWTFAKSGKPLYVRDGNYFGIVLNDDFENLLGHQFHVQGWEE